MNEQRSVFIVTFPSVSKFSFPRAVKSQIRRYRDRISPSPARAVAVNHRKDKLNIHMLISLSGKTRSVTRDSFILKVFVSRNDLVPSYKWGGRSGMQSDWPLRKILARETGNIKM